MLLADRANTVEHHRLGCQRILPQKSVEQFPGIKTGVRPVSDRREVERDGRWERARGQTSRSSKALRSKPYVSADSRSTRFSDSEGENLRCKPGGAASRWASGAIHTARARSRSPSDARSGTPPSSSCSSVAILDLSPSRQPSSSARGLSRSWAVERACSRSRSVRGPIEQRPKPSCRWLPPRPCRAKSAVEGRCRGAECRNTR